MLCVRCFGVFFGFAKRDTFGLRTQSKLKGFYWLCRFRIRLKNNGEDGEEELRAGTFCFEVLTEPCQFDVLSSNSFSSSVFEKRSFGKDRIFFVKCMTCEEFTCGCRCFDPDQRGGGGPACTGLKQSRQFSKSPFSKYNRHCGRCKSVYIMTAPKPQGPSVVRGLGVRNQKCQHLELVRCLGSQKLNPHFWEALDDRGAVHLSGSQSDLRVVKLSLHSCNTQGKRSIRGAIWPFYHHYFFFQAKHWMACWGGHKLSMHRSNYAEARDNPSGQWYLYLYIACSYDLMIEIAASQFQACILRSLPYFLSNPSRPVYAIFWFWFYSCERLTKMQRRQSVQT